MEKKTTTYKQDLKKINQRYDRLMFDIEQKDKEYISISANAFLFEVTRVVH